MAPIIKNKSTPFFLLIIFILSGVNNIPAGYLFLSGDYNQIFSFSVVLDALKYNWASYGLGGFFMLFSYFPYYYFFGILQRIVGASHIFSFFSLFFLLGSFFSFKVAAKMFFPIKRELLLNGISFAYALNIYTFNKFFSPTPFSFLYLMIPLIFATTYRYVLSDRTFNKNLAVSGVVLFVSNIAFGNAAFFISLNIFLFIFLLLILFLHKKNIDVVLFFKKIIIFYTLFFLTSFLAIVPQIPGLFGMVNDFSSNNGYFNLDDWIFWQALDFKGLWFFSDNVSDAIRMYSPTILLAGMFFFIFFIIAVHIKYANTRLVALFSGLVFFAIFLINKGKGILSKGAIMKIFGGNLIFSSIRSLDKTLIFLPFFMLVIILIFLEGIKSKKTSYVASGLFLLVVILPLYPAFQGKLLTNYLGINIGKDYKSSEYSYIVKIPNEYYELSTRLNMQKSDFRLFSIPYNVLNSIGWINYPKWKAIGSDPTIQLFDQQIVQMNAPQAFGNWNYGKTWNGQENEEAKWLVPFSSLLGIKYIIYHKDVADVFIQQTIDKMQYYEKNNLIIKIEDNDYFNVYKINATPFAHFYAARNSIVSGRSIEILPKILSSDNWQTRSAVFLAGQNVGKEDFLAKIQNQNLQISNQDQNLNDQNLNNIAQNDNSCEGQGGVTLPTLEFKKINPTKYRVRVHGASGVFPLVFSESFNDGWKGYLVKSAPFSPPPSPRARLDSARQAGEGAIANYKILDGNEEDQATKDELQDYVDNGYVTTLGDGKAKTIEHKKWVDPVKSSADDHGASGKEQLDYVEKYRIDFVSKNFQGTIQNDNLPNGSLFETWFQRPIENNANHLMVNGYANSWVIDTASLCAPSSPQPSPRAHLDSAWQAGEGEYACIKNPDGSYDFEMVVEFWPQRLFYIGLVISGLTLLGCISYLGYDWKKRRKQKKLDPKIV